MNIQEILDLKSKVNDPALNEKIEVNFLYYFKN